MQKVPPKIVALAGNLRLDVAGAEVMRRFGHEGIPCILLKGPAFARLLYETPQERAYIDVDLLVAPEDYERAGKELERLGFTCSNPAPRIPLDRPMDGRAWVRKDGTVDLHQSVPEVAVEPEEAWSYLWPLTQQEDLRGTPVRVLDVPRRALLVGLHAAHHGHSSPKGLEDLRRAIHVLDRDTWDEAARSARYLCCEAAFATGLRLIPEGVSLASELGLSDGVWAEGALQLESGGAESLGVALALERMSSLRGARTRATYFLRKLFPPRTYMREWLRAHPGRGGLWAAYVRRLGAYAGHFLRGARRWRRARGRSSGRVE
jgi:hypothetical protein